MNVKTDNDTSTPWITGCTVMPNGHVVLCDRKNAHIKLLDDTWIITDQLKLQGPRDVSVIDSRHVIVTSPDTKQLHSVQVLPQMKAERIIKLDKACWGVAVSGDEMYITCQNNPGDGEVRVLDLNGTLKRRLGIHQDESYLFKCPNYITVNTFGEIFVSDTNTNTITCLTSSGSVTYEYKDDDMRRTGGLICNSGDNILVCGVNSQNTHVIHVTADGKKNRTLLSSNDGLREPWSIAYKASEYILVIGCGCYGSYKVLLLKLSE